MRQFTRQQLREAAEEDEGVCVRCGKQQDLSDPGNNGLSLCEDCGAQAVIDAATVLQIAGLIIEED